MKRLVVLTAVAALLSASLAAPAEAKKKKPKAPAPVTTTFFFHGNSQIGEPDGLNGATGMAPFPVMDTTEPSGGTPRSMVVTSYVGGPNTACAGSFLSPVWIGDVTGHVVGEAKVVFDAISSPAASVDVQLFADTVEFNCDSATPVASVRVPLPTGPGQVEAAFESLDFSTIGKLMLQITPVLDTPYYARVLYDSADYPGSFEFSCVPPEGQTNCTPVA